MKINMKKILATVAVALAAVALVSCDNYLDKYPENAVTPEVFFSSDQDLAAYSINLYNNSISNLNPGQYGIGVWGWDNHTDNQAAQGYSSRFVPGEIRVGNGNENWNWNEIRNCNYFFDNVLPKKEAGQIQGAESLVNHYIGEVYLIRAYHYFSALKSVGDFPIVTTALPDKAEVLVEASKRQPRHKVARFILQDLDQAIDLLQQEAPGGKSRIGKDVAYLLKSRVALYEATWLKYHKGTALVPGGSGWPGNSADLAGFDIDSEINFFLDEAMKAAKVVGDKLVNNLVENTDTPEGMDSKLMSLNPYYTMFTDTDMNKYSEVLMWRAFDKDLNITHNIQMQLERDGGGTGYTRGLVNSFLMRNGLPIYDPSSGYDKEWEKEGITATLQDRDSRIQIFTKGDESVDYYSPEGEPVHYNHGRYLLDPSEQSQCVTGFPLKKGKYYEASIADMHHRGATGSVIFRGTEALLNYMEASFERTGTVDATAAKYWKALRERAYVDPNFEKTIAATDMNQEAKGDWGAYSHGKLIDPTLYNIRRERRNEFIAEGMRWDDLKRWRALDQVKGYQIEGIRYWDSVYEGAFIDEKGKDLVVVDLSGKGNMSPEENSPYIRPYQKSKVNNRVYDGYNFIEAYYLNPLGMAVFRTTSEGDQTNLETSVVYQNPGWPKIGGQGPIGY